jgi:hypothetical protein
MLPVRMIPDRACGHPPPLSVSCLGWRTNGPAAGVPGCRSGIAVGIQRLECTPMRLIRKKEQAFKGVSPWKRSSMSYTDKKDLYRLQPRVGGWRAPRKDQDISVVDIEGA